MRCRSMATIEKDGVDGCVATPMLRGSAAVTGKKKNRVYDRPSSKV